MLEFIIAYFNYWIYIVLMMIGLYAMISKRNMIKKLIGMSIFQTAIMLFYVSIGVKKDATIPILEHGHGEAASHGTELAEQVTHAATATVNAADYANPLPHVLMLTAIVVGVATLGVALAVVQKVHGYYGTIEENEIQERVRL